MGKNTACVLVISFVLFSAATCAFASPNYNAGWALHFAGAHDAKGNTCALSVQDCRSEIVTYAPKVAGRYDIYIIAVLTAGIAGTRYGICCGGPFYFYGWTKCSDFEIPTAGWPGCGEGNAQTWISERPPGQVTIGILDVYAYGSSSYVEACVDPRKGFAEWCDGSSPEPICNRVTDSVFFGAVGFGQSGYNPCIWDYVEPYTWGAVKALYR
jgi:hypothetical protein